MCHRVNVNRQSLFWLLLGIAVGFILSKVARDRQETAGPQVQAVHLEDVGVHSPDEEFHRMEDSTVSDLLYEKVRVLCWIMTAPGTHKSKAVHVKATWGRRCNKLLFMSSEQDESLPTVALPVGEGRENLWAKTKAAFAHVHANHLDDADWFLKADDDTYVILDNLRYMLLPYEPEEPIYFGCRLKAFQGFMSGGAGYVLSKEAVRRFVETGLAGAVNCTETEGPEDALMGQCLRGVDVRAGDSRDSLGRGRFFPYGPEYHLVPGYMPKDFWYWKFIYYDSKEGMECCSDNAVSFHYITPNQMYVLEYLIYHLRPYGISYKAKMPPELEKKGHSHR